MQLRTVVSTKIARPLRDVFRAFADPRYSAKVDAATQSATPLSDDPVSKGAVWRLKINGPLGTTLTEMQTITELDPPYRLVIHISQTGMSGSELETFDVESDGSVHVSWNASYDLSWWMALLSPILGPMIKRKSEAWIEAMKTAIEANDPPIPPAG